MEKEIEYYLWDGMPASKTERGFPVRYMNGTKFTIHDLWAFLHEAQELPLPHLKGVTALEQFEELLKGENAEKFLKDLVN